MAPKYGKLSNEEALHRVQGRVDILGAHPYRRPFERTWLRNIAYYLGKQHFIQDSETGRLREPGRLNPHEVQYKANFLVGFVQRAVNAVSTANGDFQVPPKDGSRKERHKSYVSNKLFEHIIQAQQVDDKKATATLWAALCGSGFYRVRWDAQAGEPTRYYLDDNGLPMVSISEEEQMRREMEGSFEDHHAGDVAIDALSPFGVHWDWQCRSTQIDETCRWMATSQSVQIETLERVYGVAKTRGVQPKQVSGGSTYYQELISFISSGSAYAQNTSINDPLEPDDRTTLLQFWERPSPRNRNKGRFIVVAGDTVLVNGENPYGADLPFIKQDWWEAPGRFMGVSLVELLTGPQFRYNQARAKLTEFQNVHGSPATFVPKGSDIPTGHLTAKPGYVYEYNAAAGMPNFGPVPQLPAEVAGNAGIARSEMETISSMTGLEDSKLPGQVRSGPGLELMLEEKKSLLIPAARNFLSAQETLGKLTLRLARRRYTQERVANFIGPDRKWRAITFKSGDINDDLRVVVGKGGLFSNPTAERARVMEMVTSGILDPINNPEDKESVLKAMEFGTADEIVQDRLQEEENQEREILEMVSDPVKWAGERQAQFGPPGEMEVGYPINDWDDDKAHVRMLLRYIRSDEYRQLDKFTQSVVVYHLRAHQAREAQRMEQQIALQQALGSQGSQPGKASQAKQPVA